MPAGKRIEQKQQLSCSDYAALLGHWPNCAVADCPNKVCLHLDSDKCWPHTVGMPINWYKGLSEKKIEQISNEVETAYLNSLIRREV